MPVAPPGKLVGKSTYPCPGEGSRDVSLVGCGVKPHERFTKHRWHIVHVRRPPHLREGSRVNEATGPPVEGAAGSRRKPNESTPNKHWARQRTRRRLRLRNAVPCGVWGNAPPSFPLQQYEHITKGRGKPLPYGAGKPHMADISRYHHKQTIILHSSF